MERIITKGGRVAWIEKSPNGKVRYYYEECVCGVKKNPKSSYCPSCNKENFKVRIPIDRTIDEVKSKEFVDRIMKRNGMCSTNELFVELIDIHEMNFYMLTGIDELEPREQLLEMWNKLKEKYA